MRSSHAFGAAFDNPDLLVACVVGDGEAETGPLATSWHSNKFLNAKSDGAVLPILHLNGYKIANPTVLARIPERELTALFEGYGWRPLLVSGGSSRGRRCTSASLRRSTRRSTTIAESSSAAREDGAPERPRWPMIDPAHAEGMDRAEGSRRRARSKARGARTRFQSLGARDNAEHREPARARGCAATGRRSCSTRTGALVRELHALRAAGRPRG